MNSPTVASLRQSLPRRLKAAGIHFSLSLAVFAVALYLILVEWYPGFHFGVDGGWQGVRIMAAVDLVLGPFLTLVIFNPFKERRLIVFDLSCIALVQVGALIWGFYAISGQRPVSLNYFEGVFYSVPAKSLRSMEGSRELIDRLSQTTPRLIYVAQPANPAEVDRARQRGQLKLLAHEDSFFFRSLAEHWDEVQAAAVNPAELQDEQFRQGHADFVAKRGGQPADYRFLRYQGGYGSCLLAFTARGELLDAIGCASQ